MANRASPIKPKIRRRAARQRELDRHDVRYVLVGGVAVSFYGLGRMTQHIDLFVETDADNIDRLKRALSAVFDDPSIEEISADDLAGEYPTVRYLPPDGVFVIDLLGRLREAFSFDDLEAADMEVEGVRVRVATTSALLLTSHMSGPHTYLSCHPTGEVIVVVEPKSSILQGTLDLMVLKTLESMGPMHGYGIARRIEQVGEQALVVNQGTIYLCLVRLVQKRWVSARWGTSENNRRAKFYTITKAGRDQLRAETQNWERIAGVIGRVLQPEGGS